MKTIKLHQLSRGEVVALLGGIYEHAPWVAESLVDQGLTKVDSNSEFLAGRMRSIVDAAHADKKLELLCAHPELAGKLALSGDLTKDSNAEQLSAGLDQCSKEELAEFQQLNRVYKTRFGHPFILAVRGFTRAKILNEFRNRLLNQKETEFAIALAEVHKIARFRLSDLLDSFRP